MARFQRPTVSALFEVVRVNLRLPGDGGPVRPKFPIFHGTVWLLAASLLTVAALPLSSSGSVCACGGGDSGDSGNGGDSGSDNEGESGEDQDTSESEPPPGFRPTGEIPWLAGKSGEAGSGKGGKQTQDLLNIVNKIGISDPSGGSPAGIVQGAPDVQPAGIDFFRSPPFDEWRSRFAVQFRQFELLNLTRTRPWGQMHYSWSQLQMLLSRDLMALLRDYARRVGFVIYGLHGVHGGPVTSPKLSTVPSLGGFGSTPSSGGSGGSGSSNSGGTGSSTNSGTEPDSGSGGSGGTTGTNSGTGATSGQNLGTKGKSGAIIATTTKGRFSLPPPQPLYNWGGSHLAAGSGTGTSSAPSSPAGAKNVAKGTLDVLSGALLTPAQQEAAKEASSTVNNFMEKTTEKVSQMLHSLATGDYEKAERQSNDIWGNAQQRLQESGKHGAMVGKGLSETPSAALLEAGKTVQADTKSTFSSRMSNIFAKHAMKAAGK